MKATHVVIEDVGRFLRAGEKVYIETVFDGGVRVQSINPSYKDGLWATPLSNLKRLNENLENK